MKKITVALVALVALVASGCDEQKRQTYKPHHAEIPEMYAYGVVAEPEVELWVVMIPEGDFIERCASNFQGAYQYDGTRRCIVPAP